MNTNILSWSRARRYSPRNFNIPPLRRACYEDG